MIQSQVWPEIDVMFLTFILQIVPKDKASLSLLTKKNIF